MALQFLDANIIIRHVTKDSPKLSQQAYDILQQVELGTLLVTTCESIITECVYVLSSKHIYRFTRPQIKMALDIILSFKGLKLPHKRVYRRALQLYVASAIDFPDALAIAHMERQKISAIYSFDEDFDNIAGIKRRITVKAM